MVDVERLSPHRQTFELPPPNSCSHALLDKVGFEFRDAADEGDEEPSHRAIGRDILSLRNELDTEGVQFVNDAKKMFRAACHSVKGRDDEHCELLLPCFTKHRIESRTPSLAAGDADIGELADHFESTLSGELPEVV